MKKILVIEDTYDVLEEITTILSFEGFEPLSAENGLLGVKMARKYLPDLIICDIMMPGVDGYGVFNQLQQNSYTAIIPFIFLTAKASREDIRKGMNIGVDDYLTKPFLVDELLTAIKTRLDKQEMVIKQSKDKLEHLRTNISNALPHEFRTPFGSLLSASELLAEYSATMDKERIGRMAKTINRSAERLYKLVHKFLLYTRIELMVTDSDSFNEAQKINYLPRPDGIISFLAKQVAEKAEREADLELKLDYAPILVSEEHLQYILLELVDNAFKFSTTGEPVRIFTTASPEFFTIHITNRGRSMSKEQIAGISAYRQFERKFYEQQGLGLGLIIAKRLTELYSGQLTIESIPTEETTVSISFKYQAKS